MLSKNHSTFLLSIVKDGKFQIDQDDEIIRDTLVTMDGSIMQPRIRELLGLPDHAEKQTTAPAAAATADAPGPSGSVAESAGDSNISSAVSNEAASQQAIESDGPAAEPES